MIKLVKNTSVGTIRIKSSNLKAYEKTTKRWVRSTKDVSCAQKAIKLFKANKRIGALIDAKNPAFLKGQLTKEGLAIGARISILPNGEKLEKAYSLFSPNLKIHDQSSHDHWDVIYQNKGGTYSYVYTCAKRALHRSNKYKKVDIFEKQYPSLIENVG